MPNGYLHQRRKRQRLITLSLAAATLTGGTAVLLWAWPDGDYLPTTAAGPGHGRGLSQTGAFDHSQQGWTADTILAHYYPGADLGAIGPTTVRVRITSSDDKPLVVASDSAFFVAGRRVIPGQAAHLTPTATGADITITQGCTGETLWEGTTDDPYAYPAADGTNRPANEQLEICGGNAYRGVLGVALDNGSYRTINDVDVDDYLQGVVPAEMVPNWADQGGAEALRAQAIAARSYALAEQRYSYAQTCDTTDCQMYPGTDKEDARTSAAVQATSGRVLLRQNHILRSEYSAAPDGGTPTPVETLEVGPSIDQFPAAAAPSTPGLPFLTDPAAPTETAPTDPAYPDSTPVDPSAPELSTPTTATDTEYSSPNPRTRVGAPAPLPPNTFRVLSDQLWSTQPATPEVAIKPVLPPNTAAPSTASTPTPPSIPFPIRTPQLTIASNPLYPDRP
ncbi:SpoIID/LytB domain-containing protein [Nocardia sp. NPDC051030]|uniref:SpoIID/LytB domain-containing protein n=1 Tax=Nocardia sp. NPDC051030 TaxID=3155162 RepID=UPI00342ED522